MKPDAACRLELTCEAVCTEIMKCMGFSTNQTDLRARLAGTRSKGCGQNIEVSDAREKGGIWRLDMKTLEDDTTRLPGPAQPSCFCVPYYKHGHGHQLEQEDQGGYVKFYSTGGFPMHARGQLQRRGPGRRAEASHRRYRTLAGSHLLQLDDDEGEQGQVFPGPAGGYLWCILYG